MAWEWKCPDCEDVRLGRKVPGRRNADLRVCMDCTLAKGALVFRKRGREVRVRRAAKRLLPSGLWRGLDLQAECDRLVHLEIAPPHLRYRRPVVTVCPPPSKKCRVAGWAKFRSREITIHATQHTARCAVYGTLVHELAHLWCGPEESHGDWWRMTMVELVREGYREEPETPDDWTKGALDASCERALARWLRRGSPMPPAPDPEEGPRGQLEMRFGFPAGGAAR